MRWVVATLLLAALAVLQVSMFARFSIAGAAPQVVLLSVVAWSLVRGPIEGIYWGFAGGLLYDFASGGPIGVSALAMLAVFIASGVFFIIVGFLLATLHYPTDWRSVFVDVAFPTAIANAVLGLAVYPVFAFVASKTSGQLRVEF